MLLKLEIHSQMCMSIMYFTCPVHCSLNSDGPPLSGDPSGKVSVKFPPHVSSQRKTNSEKVNVMTQKPVYSQFNFNLSYLGVKIFFSK